ncbi:MAG: TM0106 family RecB-like putative nuclease [Flavobacteriaceae bacterium]|nr:TM0106 family RecB-like putative nuclease [Flavobacteriaceae bacterium]
MSLVLTPEIISSYFLCKRKSFLLSKSTMVDFKKTEFEKMVDKYAFDIKKAYIDNNDVHPFRNGLIEKGINLIKDINIKTSNYYFQCDLLQKAIGKSDLGNYHYEPIIFLGQNKNTKYDRIKLAVLGLILGEIQGKRPVKGFIVKRDGSKQRSLIESLYPEIEYSILEIKAFRKQEPPVYLNKNCVVCSFKKNCKEIAIKEDNLSLIRRISQKKIIQLERKGIFTVKQLSYLYKPRKRKKNKNLSNESIFKPEIQALAIRTNKIFLKEIPKINIANFFYIIDIESIPDSNLFYLFGILEVKKGKHNYFPFWSDTKEDELLVWRKAINFLKLNTNAPIFHYGSYELKVFEKLSKNYCIDVNEVTERFVNINALIYGKIYFPTYSNQLKTLAKTLGFKWRNNQASGIDSIVWRFYWKQGDIEYKNKILIYNEDDCIAVKFLIDELYRIQKDVKTSDHIEFIDKVKDNYTEIGKKLRNQFEIALELAHNKYNNKKIKVNFEKNQIEKSSKKTKSISKYRWLNKNLKKPDKTIFLPSDKYCLIHKKQSLNKSKLKSKKIIFDLVFTKNGIRKNIVEYIGEQAYCPICKNAYASLKFREISRGLYGHNLMAWVVFQRIQIQLSFSKISNSLQGLINEKIRPATGVVFVERFSKYYLETENEIITKLLESPFIHVDETTVSILGETQYVWVLTSDKYVLLKLTKNRDVSIIKELLCEYSGVLISDFFAGYDSVDCLQQKCWVHLIRDLNNDLWKNPFDKEYEKFVSAVRDVIIPIIESAYKFGLKQYHFAKHEKSIKIFYSVKIEKIFYKSELCKKYQKRFKRYKYALFTFINFDGISWHNNIAENRIRHICVQRKISGSFGPIQFPHYLRMLSIMQTCRLQNKSFLSFLLSKEKFISCFKNGKRRFDMT